MQHQSDSHRRLRHAFVGVGAGIFASHRRAFSLPTVEIVAAKRLISEGRLGQIQRVEVLAAWTRAESYYRSSPWRGSWRGEGGAVLLNQAPHNLDGMCYLVGMPSRVVGWSRTRLQPIE